MAKFSEKVSNQAGALLNWFDDRLPVTALWKAVMTDYQAPKNFNFWYYMGVLSLVVLVIQILTGIFLTMHYKPSAAEAFASVEYIMRDVEWGWLLRYMHSTGASAFFIVVFHGSDAGQLRMRSGPAWSLASDEETDGALARST